MITSESLARVTSINGTGGITGLVFIEHGGNINGAGEDITIVGKISGSTDGILSTGVPDDSTDITLPGGAVAYTIGAADIQLQGGGTVVGAVNICLNPVDLRDAAAPPPFVAPMEPSILIHVPLVEENAYCDPQTGLALLQKLQHGGVWVGLNNVGNGFLAALQMANQNGRFSPVLTNVKKGYIHG